MSIEHPISGDIRKLERMRAEIRAWSIGSLVAVFLMLAIGVGIVVSGIQGLFKPGPVQNEFAADLGTDLNSNIAPSVQLIATQAITQSEPAMQAQFTKLNERLPDMSNAFMAQFEQLQKDLPDEGNKVLSSTLGDTLKTEEPKIRAMYPDVTDQNVNDLIDNVTNESQGQISSAAQTLFSHHVDALNSIIADINKIKDTETVNPNQDQANLQMAVAVVGAFNTDLASAGGGSAKPKKVKKS